MAAVAGEWRVVPGELLVEYVSQADAGQQARVRSSIAGSLLETLNTPIRRLNGSGALERYRLSSASSMDDALARLRRDPSVRYAEPNYVYRKMDISNDTYYTNGSLWGMYSDDNPSSGPAGTTNQFGSQAEKAWRDGFIGSSNVIVGIIDEGVQIKHPDINDNIWTNPFEIPADGVDNDGNGYVDDVNGWDFVNNDNSVYDAGQDSHGTHVAGTIGGEGGNGSGVVGVNWDVTMIPLKFLGADGGTTTDAVRAIDYLTDLKVRHGLNIVASNNSWGGGGYSQSLHDAIIRAAKANILFVAAAGNDGTNNDVEAEYPAAYNTTVGTSTESAASYDAVISVASISSNGSLSGFSNYGASTVDIAAPGDGIWSTVPSNTYANYSGTSMATPHVTGAVALYASIVPAGTSAATIRQAIVSTATPTSSLSGKVATGGRLNVYNAIRGAQTLTLDRSVYGAPSTATLSVVHTAANVNTSVVETITATIRSTSESSPETVTLTETGVNTGRFTGTIPLAAGTPAANGVLEVAHNDTITATYAGLGQTVTATVDAVAPTLSGLNIVPKVSVADIRWTTNEPSTTEVAYGLSSTSLNLTSRNLELVNSHAATLTGLAPSTTYFYELRSRDAAGNVVVSPIGSFTTVATAPYLFVDDDMGESYERFFTAALNANSYVYDVWDVAAVGSGPTAADLTNYDIVVWNTGSDYQSSTAGLSSADQAALTSYLDGGGRLYLSGQDALYTGTSATFRQNYLKVASYRDDVISANHTEAGIAGNLVSFGMSLSLTKPLDYPSLYVDAVTPAAGAQGMFLHGVAGAPSAFSSISYRGDYNAGGFGVVFTTFPFESVSATASNPNNQRTLMKRIFDFLDGTAVPVSIDVGAPTPGGTTTEAGGSASFTVSLSTAPTANVTIPVSVSDTTEGRVNVASLVFTATNWSVPQTVQVTGVDDTIDDGNIAFNVVLGAATSADPRYNGINPADVSFTNIDNDDPIVSSFLVVNDASPDRVYGYSTAGAANGNQALPAANAASRGIATNDDGSIRWVLNSNRVVFVYNASGTLLGSWTLGTMPTNSVVEGIATDGTHIWVVESRGDRVYYYANGAAVRSGTVAATSSFALNSQNISPKDLASDGVSIWVVNDATTDRVFRYNLSGTLQNSWLLNTANRTPTGIAIDPTDASNDVWIVDSGTDRVYRYATGRTSTAPALASSFALTTGNTVPQGVAFFPPTSSSQTRPTNGFAVTIVLTSPLTGGFQVTVTTGLPANPPSSAAIASPASPVLMASPASATVDSLMAALGGGSSAANGNARRRDPLADLLAELADDLRRR
jgi:subtilisin family serine protease